MVENGNFYGRGATDNKAGVVALVSTILRFHRERSGPRVNWCLLLSATKRRAWNRPAFAAHPWVRNAEFAINTDAGSGIIGEDIGKPLIYLIQGAEGFCDVTSSSPIPAGTVQGRAATTRSSTWLMRSSGSGIFAFR